MSCTYSSIVQIFHDQSSDISNGDQHSKLSSTTVQSALIFTHVSGGSSKFGTSNHDCICDLAYLHLKRVFSTCGQRSLRTLVSRDRAGECSTRTTASQDASGKHAARRGDAFQWRSIASALHLEVYISVDTAFLIVGQELAWSRSHPDARKGTTRDAHHSTAWTCRRDMIVPRLNTVIHLHNRLPAPRQ